MYSMKVCVCVCVCLCVLQKFNDDDSTIEIGKKIGQIKRGTSGAVVF